MSKYYFDMCLSRRNVIMNHITTVRVIMKVNDLALADDTCHGSQTGCRYILNVVKHYGTKQTMGDETLLSSSITNAIHICVLHFSCSFIFSGI